MTDAPKIAVVMVAAGRGHRAGEGLPKQYRAMPDGGGDTVLARSLNAFAQNKHINKICTVIHQNDVKLYNNSIKSLTYHNFIFCHGGAERQDSVRLGLEALAQQPDGAPDIVLIHDAARPYVSDKIIDACVDALKDNDGALPALPVTDTLKRANNAVANAVIGETVPRDDLYRAQTPQAFHFDKILAAHQAAAAGMTDDAAVAEAAGLRVALVDGDSRNIKLTHEDDFMSTALMPRTGMGFDVHRFDAPGSAEAIMLGGIAIAHDRTLIGHSDADVALHAITDALLGALAAGDIGDHFPPSDETNKDRPSADFLHHAVALAADKQARISHIDLTLICEQPKIGPHRNAMRQSIAEICGLSVAQVAVKATTTEGLGFTGRGEGLAAQAVASLLMPEGR
ncbi:MAG: bifunctional 2-C-methyl-D-erythritol 4-phosphate cytidylyltransferase/2-C-methyl-D-erythritol 2,4-cyclodiphosphate synthase [Parvibaculales bacterium]